MSAWQIGRKMSDEARAKMREAAKRRWSNPSARAEHSEKGKLFSVDPEKRIILSEMGKRGAASRWSKQTMKEIES